jgi:hypothetical protein
MRVDCIAGSAFMNAPSNNFADGMVRLLPGAGDIAWQVWTSDPETFRFGELVKLTKRSQCTWHKTIGGNGLWISASDKQTQTEPGSGGAPKQNVSWRTV